MILDWASVYDNPTFVDLMVRYGIRMMEAETRMTPIASRRNGGRFGAY